MSSTFTCPHDATYVWDFDDRATFQATAAITIIAIPAIILLNGVADRGSGKKETAAKQYMHFAGEHGFG